MKKFLSFSVLLLALYGFVFVPAYTSIEFWGYDDVERAVIWVGPNGTMNLQGAQDGSRWIVWPSGTLPTGGANAEFVIYGATDANLPLNPRPGPEQNFERFSITQMNNLERNVRLTMERSGTGQFRELWIGFDNGSPDGATFNGYHYPQSTPYFPLRITVDGVFVCTVQNVCTRIGG